jgi:hypothetical protein
VLDSYSGNTDVVIPNATDRRGNLKIAFWSYSSVVEQRADNSCVGSSILPRTTNNVQAG